MTEINWKIGIEVELLAPPGKSRLDLAQAICDRYQGRVHPFFHPQSEPSQVPGTPIFHNLTIGYEIFDAQQNSIAKCVDDLTLQGDLNRQAPPQPGWYRIVSDDERLLRLIKQQTQPELPLAAVMQPIARLFGTTPESGVGGMIRVNDEVGASIAIAAPLPGQRERPCELITAPLSANHQAQLESYLSLARSLNFTAPLEGATHIHFDATALQSAGAIANLVNLLWIYGDILKQTIGTNPNCRRLGQWSNSLVNAVSTPDFDRLNWTEVQAKLQQTDLTKYCDFNLVNCIHNIADKNTIEVRILPVYLDSKPIIDAATLFVSILEYCLESKKIKPSFAKKFSPQALRSFLNMLPLSKEQRSDWFELGRKSTVPKNR
jgi:Putative amidoligase enzyme